MHGIWEARLLVDLLERIKYRGEKTLRKGVPTREPYAIIRSDKATRRYEDLFRHWFSLTEMQESPATTTLHTLHYKVVTLNLRLRKYVIRYNIDPNHQQATVRTEG